MRFRTLHRIRVLAVSLAAVTATTTLFAIAGAAGPAAAATSSGCPASRTGLPTASNVAAGVTTAGHTSTYTFASLTNENPSAGVPGLLRYCVYTTPQPNSATAAVKGDNGAAWIVGTGKTNFAFVRPGGNPSNIGLDGTSHTIGTATWTGTAPSNQSIVLHINDPATCASLYGAGTSATCFVTPSPLPPPGPICDQGDTTVAYNAMPTDVVNCLNPGVAFEANQWNEFGDSVTLKTGTGRTLKSLSVDFQSFACVTGTWDNQGGSNPCGGTTTGVSPGTFTWPITANIYAADAVTGLPTTLLATTGPVNEQIPFRPNADPTNCPLTPNKWFNPQALGGGACQNSIATVLTFNNWIFQSGFTGTLPENVVWTVAFNTSTSGYTPQGAQTPPCTFTAATPGSVCPQNPADSLNVGDHSLPNAPYAGTSLFDTSGKAVGSQGPPSTPLGFFTPDDNGRPLGEIITTP
jgi:hypothetical protein